MGGGEEERGKEGGCKEETEGEVVKGGGGMSGRDEREMEGGGMRISIKG